MRVSLNGPFRVFDDAGRDATPKGIKERGLLALMIMSPGQRRSRVWVQDKLWSESDAAQASGSCRQALSNVRKALGPIGARLQSDRSAIWIDPPIPLTDAYDPSMGELLDDIDIRDPEFCDWLRGLRMQQDASVAVARPVAPSNPPPTASPDRRALVPIVRIDRSGTARGTFILRALSQRIAMGLLHSGGVDVVELDAEDRLVSSDQPTAHVEIECLDDSDHAFVLLRVVAPPNRRVTWSGRLSIAPSLSAIWESEDVARAVNRAIQAVCDTAPVGHGGSPLLTLNRAIRRVFEFDRAGLIKADLLFAEVVDSDLRGPALAWRGFARLTAALEFREADAVKLSDAMPLVEEAMRASPNHPVVLALASQITLRMTGDVDTAHYLAERAVEQDEDNPYALDALCQTLIMQHRYGQANIVAERARKSAQGLPHSFTWDLQACLSAISVGNIQGALDLALSSHRKMPFYRPALRYLTALSSLFDRPTDSARYAKSLLRLEPDFTPRLLLNDTYPVGTLRDLGLIDKLRSRLE
jgi:hypothetical protein